MIVIRKPPGQQGLKKIVLSMCALDVEGAKMFSLFFTGPPAHRGGEQGAAIGCCMVSPYVVGCFYFFC